MRSVDNIVAKYTATPGAPSGGTAPVVVVVVVVVVVATYVCVRGRLISF